MLLKMPATLLTVVLGAALLSGCQAEQTEKDMLAEAQFCLDKATDQTSSDACMSKISGLTSPQAYTLRCAAGFIGAEITSPANLSTALNAIGDGAGTTSMLSALSFPSTTAAINTFNDCNQSGQSGLKLIGAMAKSATVLANAAGSLASCADITSCDPQQLESTMADLLANLTAGGDSQAQAEEVITAIVSSIQTVHASTCGGSADTNTDICGQINAAVAESGMDIATSDPAEILAIGRELLSQWQQ